MKLSAKFRNASKEEIKSLMAISEMGNPELHMPLPNLYKISTQEQINHYKVKFIGAVNTYIEFAYDAAQHYFNEYANDLLLEPEKKDIIFQKYRNHHIGRIQACQQFSYLYTDYKEQEYTIELLSSIADELWNISYKHNEMLITALWLLQKIYSHYWTVQELNLRQDLNTLFHPKNERREKSYEKTTLMEWFDKPGKYPIIMGLLVENGLCQPGTYLWIDESVGAKTAVATLIKYLHAQGFYTDNMKPLNEEIILIAKQTFGVVIGIDTVKKAKVPTSANHNLSFISPASTH